KPEFLKKAQRANPRLYEIGCYNDNLALMLAPDTNEVIRLEKESRSKLSDLIRPFDYDKLNNLRNRTLVEAARTMLSAAKVPLFFWAEAIATTCFTQNRYLVIPRHEKTPYHIINDRKSSVKFFHIVGSLCYIVIEGENLDKIKEKDHVSCDPVLECQRMALEHDSLSPDLQCQDNVPQADRTVTTSNELNLLFSLMFDELLNGSSKVVPKSFAVSTADALDQHQQHTTPLNTQTTTVPTCQV
nr:hypothetical protein [Tanacetum cinerariifolium]